MLAQRFRLMNMMMLGAVAAAATNLLFVWLALRGHDVPLMYTAVGLDNFAAGLAGTVFVAFFIGAHQQSALRRCNTRCFHR